MHHADCMSLLDMHDSALLPRAPSPHIGPANAPHLGATQLLTVLPGESVECVASGRAQAFNMQDETRGDAAASSKGGAERGCVVFGDGHVPRVVPIRRREGFQADFVALRCGEARTDIV